MPDSGESSAMLLAVMRRRGEATRPQLARATGLSLVTVNRAVARLCERGEFEAAGEVPSGGGRPVQLYRLRRSDSWHALLRLVVEPHSKRVACRLCLLDPLGQSIREARALFGHLEEKSFDGWLDSQLRSRRRLRGIVLEAGSTPLPPGLLAHLAGRYACPARRVSAADALAERRENSLCLCLPRHAPPCASVCRMGRLAACGELSLLPLPSKWGELDYEDHTLVEEMVARLLLILCCTHAPARVDLHADFWSERLLRRIRYNLDTKLQGFPAPSLRFHRLAEAPLTNALQSLAIEG